MKRFNIGDVIYSTNSNQVMVVDHEVIIDDEPMGCIAQYFHGDAFNPENEGIIFSAFISYENYEMNYYELLEENKLGRRN